VLVLETALRHRLGQRRSRMGAESKVEGDWAAR